MHYNPSHIINQTAGLCVYMLLIFQNAFNECQQCAGPVVGWQVECTVGECFSLGFTSLLLRELRGIKGKEGFILWSWAMRMWALKPPADIISSSGRSWPESVSYEEVSLPWILNSFLTCLPDSTLVHWWSALNIGIGVIFKNGSQMSLLGSTPCFGSLSHTE